MTFKMKDLNKDERMVINMVIEAYVSVMGIDKWNSLTVEQQHDVIMTIIKGLLISYRGL